jgi:hypothetical protein
VSRLIRRGHLILVTAFGKRIADPPMTPRERRLAEARQRAREQAAAKRRR